MLLQVLVLGCCAFWAAEAQNLRMGGCSNYQGDRNFDINYIHTLTDEPDGFYITMTTGSVRSCQRVTFLPGGKFIYSYIDEFQVPRNFSGPYTATAATFTAPGFIELDNLPVGELGADLGGDVRLMALISDDTKLVTISCVPLGVVSIEQIQAMVPGSKFSGSSGLELKRHFFDVTFPYRERLNEVSQICIPNVRGTTPTFDQLLKIYNILAKLGIVPALPFRENMFRGTSPAELETVIETQLANVNISLSALQALVAESENNNEISSDVPAAVARPYFRSALDSPAVSPSDHYPRSSSGDSTVFSNSQHLNSVISRSDPVGPGNAPVVYAHPIRQTNSFVPTYPQTFIQTRVPANQIYTRFYA